MNLRRYQTFLGVLAVMIVGLMALGAGVRTMNAGLSCPDWPLCFGKVIPDFHVGVWFEFVHRAYAGLVAILFVAALVIALRSKDVPTATKTAAKWGLGFLTLQIVMGGLTVLLLVKAIIVTSHLLLATLFFGCVMWMWFGVRAELHRHRGGESAIVETAFGPTATLVVEQGRRRPLHPIFGLLPILVFCQIAIGGLVASTYAGSVCVDWPLCNGKWVPTWKGAIGLQIIHRFVAYALVALFVTLAIWAWRKKDELSSRASRLFYAAGIIVVLQTIVGIMNLLYFIPPHITVPHQTLAMLLLATSLGLAFEQRWEQRRQLSRTQDVIKSSESLAAQPVPLS